MEWHKYEPGECKGLPAAVVRGLVAASDTFEQIYEYDGETFTVHSGMAKLIFVSETRLIILAFSWDSFTDVAGAGKQKINGRRANPLNASPFPPNGKGVHLKGGDAVAFGGEDHIPPTEYAAGIAPKPPA